MNKIENDVLLIIKNNWFSTRKSIHKHLNISTSTLYKAINYLLSRRYIKKVAKRYYQAVNRADVCEIMSLDVVRFAKDLAEKHIKEKQNENYSI